MTSEELVDAGGLAALLQPWIVEFGKRQDSEKPVLRVLLSVDDPRFITEAFHRALGDTEVVLQKGVPGQHLHTWAAEVLCRAGLTPRQDRERLWVSLEELKRVYLYLVEKYGGRRGRWREIANQVYMALASRPEVAALLDRTKALALLGEL